MKNSILIGAALVVLLGGVASADDDGNDRHVLKFKTMTGVPRPYTGAANAVRGVPGGGLPWVVSSAKGELSADGKLEISVQGLVIDPNDPGAIAAGRAGQNPAATFRAIVSCLSRDMNGAAITTNLMTAEFPATVGFASAGGGNARIEAHLQLPSPCIAPIVFVASAAGSWFASTGM